MKVVYDQNMPAVEDCLGHCCELSAVDGRSLSRQQLREADALLVRSVTRVDAALLAGSPVAFVGSATSGLDHVDRAWLSAQGIGFAHAAGANANAVVEYVLSAIATLGDTLERLLHGGTLGIVGYGNVGRLLAERCAALGIDWCAHDPWLPAGAIPRAAGLDRVLGCDVISLHPELTDEAPWPSRHLLAERELAALSAEQLLINASRGPVIDNTALLQRLERDQAPAVVLDVWEGEPSISSRLLDAVALGTPHIAGYSVDAKITATRRVSEALCRALSLPQVSSAGAGRALPVLTLDETDPARGLRSLLAQRYRIRDDDRRLRAMLASSDDPASGFDQLRRNYPPRRELEGSRVALSPRAQGLSPIVTALGAQPEKEIP